MGKTFENCAFGPWALRRLLREGIGLRDRALAWGVVSEQRGLMTDVWPVIVALVPAIGPVFGAMLGGSGRPSVLVLTQTRLLLLDGKRKPGSRDWVRWEAPLGTLVIARRGRSFVARSGEEGVGVRVRPACGEERVDAALRALSKASAERRI